MTIACPTAKERHAIADARQRQSLCIDLGWATISVIGPDAQRFLQGQLSCDVARISSEQASLGCLLNLKGRIEASAVIRAIADGYELLLPAVQVSVVMARLSKYGAFSKITLSANLSRCQSRIQGLLGALPSALSSTPYATMSDDAGDYIRLPGLQRALFIGADTHIDTTNAAHAAWQASAIASGEVNIDSNLVDHWQPQELDYHQLAGVSYQKGCYMGQEIVARLYFRGQLKTGLCWLEASWPDAQAASLDWPVMSGDKAIGRVIALAWPDANSLWLLASVRLEASDLYWVIADGTRVQLSRREFQRLEGAATADADISTNS